MKFPQLIEYNMRKIFLEKSYTKCGRETSPRSFFKKSKLSISLNQQSEILCSLYCTLLYCKSKSRTTMIYWNHGADHLLLPHIKIFWKAKWSLGLVLLPHFVAWFFEEKYFSCYILLTPEISSSHGLCFLRYWAISVW